VKGRNRSKNGVGPSPFQGGREGNSASLHSEEKKFQKKHSQGGVRGKSRCQRVAIAAVFGTTQEYASRGGGKMEEVLISL